MTKPPETAQIGAHEFDPSDGRLEGPDGTRTLRPQSAQVLAVLLEYRNSLVTKSYLIDTIWADTHVTDDSLVQCISEIRKALGEDAGLIVTVPRKGYRLNPQPESETAPTAVSDPVAASVAGPGTPEPAEALPPPRRKPGRRPLLLAALFLVLMSGLAAAWYVTRPVPPRDQITLAILPFLNMSGDDDQSYFSDGVAEDLIVSLSGIADLRVLSRGTSFAVSFADQDLREVADALQADYVLEGSVRRVRDKLRVSAALVDGTTGANVWADRFDGTTEDIFDFQDEVVSNLLRTLSVRLSAAERARLGVRGTQSIAAHDAYLRGRQLENLYTRDTNIAAEDALAEALRHDPDFALAHAHLSQVYSFRVENNWTEDREGTIAAAFAAAERAVALDPQLPFARFALGRLYTRSFAPDEARAEAEYKEALRLDPNYDDAYVFLANIYIFNGRASEALPLIAEAMQRNPLPPYWYHLGEGMARYFLGEYEAAEAALVTARDQNPTAPYPYRFLMATYGQLEDPDEADWMAMEYEALGRSATVSDLLASASIQDPAYREAFAEGFRKAGLPED